MLKFLLFQCKGAKLSCSASCIGEVKGIYTIRNSYICSVYLPAVGEYNRYCTQHRSVPLGPYLEVAAAVSANLYLNPLYTLAVEILEACSSGVLHVGNVTKLLISIPAILGNIWIRIVEHGHPATEVRNLGLLLEEEVACDICCILALALQRTAVGAAGGNLNLRNRAVLKEFDLFHAALSAVLGAVSMPVVEDVPFILNLYDAAVVVAGIVGHHIGRLVSIYMEIAVTYDNATIFEVLCRMLAGGIAELMEFD